jgi:hypothetical protein
MIMIVAGPVAVDEADGEGRPSRLRCDAMVAVVVLLCLGLGAWWLFTTPQLEGGGIASVSSADHEVLWARGLREELFVVPADGAGSSMIAFEIRNGGSLPVELVDVWPSMDDPWCFWQPSERWFQDDPRYQGVLDERARPAVGAVLAPGVAATVWVTGAHPDSDGCVHGGLATFDDVEVIARVGGRRSTTRVALGYTFGYTDDLEMVRDFYEIRVLPPKESSSSD